MEIPNFPLSFYPKDLEPYGEQYVEAARTYHMLRAAWEDLNRRGKLAPECIDFVEAIKKCAYAKDITEISLIDPRFIDDKPLEDM